MTQKSSEGCTFPENRQKPVFEVIRHENLQKGRNEGRPKTVKKDKQKSSKASMSPFFLAPSARNHCFYCVFGAMRKIAAKKAKFLTLTKTLHRKKTTYLRTRCRPRKHDVYSGFVRPQNEGSIKLSWNAEFRVQLSTRKRIYIYIYLSLSLSLSLSSPTLCGRIVIGVIARPNRGEKKENYEKKATCKRKEKRKGNDTTRMEGENEQEEVEVRKRLRERTKDNESHQIAKTKNHERDSKKHRQVERWVIKEMSLEENKQNIGNRLRPEPSIKTGQNMD